MESKARSEFYFGNNEEYEAVPGGHIGSGGFGYAMLIRRRQDG